MNRDDIITKVREKLDEVTPFTNSIVDDVDLIDKLLDEAAIQVLLTVPLNTIRPYHITDYDLSVSSDNVGSLPLPDDFLRIHTVKVVGWERAVHKAYDEESNMALLQASTVTRGGLSKPVCIIGYEMNELSTSDSVGTYGSKFLYLYSMPETNRQGFERLLYVKRLLPEEMRDTLIDPLSWQCAGDVLHVTGNAEQAEVCYMHVAKFIKDNTL